MKIFFAGLSGVSNISRLEIWIKTGLGNKLISYYEISTGDGLIELKKLFEVNENENLSCDLVRR